MSKKIPALFIAIMITVSIAHGQSYTIEDIPNTKLVNNSYVSNPDAILSDAAVNKIDGILSSLEKQTTAQVAVVVVKSIGTADIFEFAQQLFDKWGIGQAGKDNGLLILLVVDQRTVRFHTGYGLEGVLPDILCKHIQVEQMVPQFKIEDYNAGILAGVEEVAYVLSNPAYANELRDETIKASNGWNVFFLVSLIGGGVIFLIWFLILQTSGGFADSKKKKKDDPYPEMRLKRWEWIILFGVLPFALLLVFNEVSLVKENHILIFLLLLYSYFII
ncbi:MAG TPA: TPM domain-containing protein, partial [Cyclobacteriaceae bacterium]